MTDVIFDYDRGDDLGHEVGIVLAINGTNIIGGFVEGPDGRRQRREWELHLPDLAIWGLVAIRNRCASALGRT